MSLWIRIIRRFQAQLRDKDPQIRSKSNRFLPCIIFRRIVTSSISRRSSWCACRLAEVNAGSLSTSSCGLSVVSGALAHGRAKISMVEPATGQSVPGRTTADRPGHQAVDENKLVTTRPIDVSPPVVLFYCSWRKELQARGPFFL